MVPIVNMISDNAKLPLCYIKGSESQRFKRSELLTQQVFDYMKNNCGNYWTVGRLKNVIDKCIYPHKINIEIENENTKDFLGNLQEIVSVENYKNTIDYIFKNFGKKIPKILNEPFTLASVDGFKLKFQMTDDKVIKNKYTVIHELRHLFDHLCNPKISVMRRNIMADAPKEEYDAYNKIYESFFDLLKYKDFEQIQKDVIKNLNVIPNYKQINILQGIRNNIKTEINAYNQELKEYCKDPFDKLKEIINLVWFKYNNAKFDQKLKFVNDLLQNCIQKERLKSNNI